jgi:hypothetical protein
MHLTAGPYLGTCVISPLLNEDPYTSYMTDDLHRCCVVGELGDGVEVRQGAGAKCGGATGWAVGGCGQSGAERGRGDRLRGRRERRGSARVDAWKCLGRRRRREPTGVELQRAETQGGGASREVMWPDVDGVPR